MRQFRSLHPRDLAEDYNAEVLGEEPVVEVEESPNRIRLSYIFPGFYLSDDEQTVAERTLPFKQLTIASTGSLGESGKPLLPSFGRYVQIPFNCDYTISVHPGDPVQFDDVLIAPAQMKLTDAADEEHEFEYDAECYSTEQPFPKELVQVSGSFELDGYNTLLVHICPFQYMPARRKLVGYANIDVIINISARDSEPDEYPDSDPETNAEVYGNLMVNPSRNIAERLRIEALLRPLPFWPLRSGPELLIIYNNDFKKAVDKLARWKEMCGLRTKVVSIDAVGNSVSEIKQFIRNKRRPGIFDRRRFRYPRLRYVLLFGDVDAIASEDIRNNRTDYYYSTKEDAADLGDLKFPWLSLGRIPVRTTQEAVDVVDQIIRYEKNPPSDPEYYRRMTFAGLIQDSDRNCRADRRYVKTMEFIRDHMIALGFDIERVYTTNNPNLQQCAEVTYYDGTAIPQEVLDTLIDSGTATAALVAATEEGQAITAHRDHGLKEGWHEPPFEQHHLEDITGDAQSIFYSLNCQTGWFDRPGGTESFAETMLRIKGGAPSLIAATRNSHSYLNDDLMKALFDGMWGGVLPTFPDSSTASYPIKHSRLGDLLGYGKSYLPIGMAGGQGSIQDHFEIYHIIGDPTLELWRDEPVQVRVSAKVIRRLGRSTYLVIRLSSCPIGSVVTVLYKGRSVKRIEPKSTTITLPIRDLGSFPSSHLAIFARGFPLYVCFKAPGCRFRKVRVHLY